MVFDKNFEKKFPEMKNREKFPTQGSYLHASYEKTFLNIGYLLKISIKKPKYDSFKNHISACSCLFTFLKSFFKHY